MECPNPKVDIIVGSQKKKRATGSVFTFVVVVVVAVAVAADAAWYICFWHFALLIL
jgi:hypothetical protein